MLSVEAPATAGVHDHFLTAGSGSVAGTTNVSTSNEDAWSSVGAEEEDPFAFSSSERIELLCKVELQREEAAARSMGRTTPVGVFEASPRTEASKAGGETGMVSNGDQKDVEDGCGKPAARKGVKAREEIEGAIETLNSSTGEEGIENAEGLDHVTVVSDVAFVEGRLEVSAQNGFLVPSPRMVASRAKRSAVNASSGEQYLRGQWRDDVWKRCPVPTE